MRKYSFLNENGKKNKEIMIHMTSMSLFVRKSKLFALSILFSKNNREKRIDHTIIINPFNASFFNN